jgi:hypothetical protein
MAGVGLLPSGQTDHIQLNVGNVLYVTLLAVLGVGFTGWVSSVLAQTEIPVVSHLAIGAQYYLKSF